MIKLSSSIKLAGIAVAAVLLGGGGVALATSVAPAAWTSPAVSHRPDADDSASARGQQGQQGQQGRTGDNCGGKAGASAKPSARPTVHASGRTDAEDDAAKPNVQPSVHRSQEPDVDHSAAPAGADDADDECGNGQDGDRCGTDGTAKSAAPRPTATPGRSDETGCQTGQHSQTDGPDQGTGQNTSGQHPTSPRPTSTGSGQGDR